MELRKNMFIGFISVRNNFLYFKGISVYYDVINKKCYFKE